MTGGTIESCLIIENEARYGGDAYLKGGLGGGVHVWSGTLRNCTVANNTAQDVPWGPFPSGVYPPGSGGGVYLDDVIAGPRLVTGCIIYFNTASESPNWSNNGGTIQFTCTTPDPADLGDITSDPQFVNLSAQDLHLLPTSPCIDAGRNEPWMLGSFDLDGNPRILDAVVDMGAYEHVRAGAASFDLNGDGCVDRADLAYLMLRIRGHSQAAAFDLNGDGRVDVADARFLVLHFTNAGGLPCNQ